MPAAVEALNGSDRLDRVGSVRRSRLRAVYAVSTRTCGTHWAGPRCVQARARAQSGMLGAMSVDREFREVVGAFATGVCVVTSEHHGHPAGMTLNSFTSVSLEPLLVLVSLAHGSRTLEKATASQRFAVNILHRRQQDVALDFAKRGADFPAHHAMQDRFGYFAVRALARAAALRGDRDRARGRPRPRDRRGRVVRGLGRRAARLPPRRVRRPRRGRPRAERARDRARQQHRLVARLAARAGFAAQNAVEQRKEVLVELLARAGRLGRGDRRRLGGDRGRRERDVERVDRRAGHLLLLGGHGDGEREGDLVHPVVIRADPELEVRALDGVLQLAQIGCRRTGATARRGEEEQLEDALDVDLARDLVGLEAFHLLARGFRVAESFAGSPIIVKAALQPA